MEKQREEARQAWKGSGEARTETVWFDIKERTGGSEFLGYETEKAEGVLTAIVVDGRETTRLEEGERGALLFNQTPFYGEAGGPTGARRSNNNSTGGGLLVEHTQR